MPQHTMDISADIKGGVFFPAAGYTAAPEHTHALLCAIINTSDDAILSKTLDGIITSWNPAAERMFGYTDAEIIGKPKTILFPPERLQEEQVILDRLQHGIATDHFETIRLHKNGTPVHISVSVSPIKNKNGEVVGASTVARDITASRYEAGQIALLSTVAAESISGIAITDARERIIYVNPAFERICGYTLEELRGRRPAEMLHGPDTDMATRRTTRSAINSGTPISIEIVNYHKDGTPYWIEMHIAAVRDKAGAITHFIAVENNITQRKRNEEMLVSLSQQNELLLITMAEGIYGLDRQGNITFINPAAAKMLGYAPEELLNRNMHALTHHSYADGTPYPAEACSVRRVLQTGIPCRSQDEVFWHKNGMAFPVEFVCTPVLQEGQVTGGVVCIQDITERKQAERQLRESEERARRVLESSPDCLTLLDNEGRLLYMSAGGMLLMEIEHFADFKCTDWLSRWDAKAQKAAKAALQCARNGQTGRFQGLCPTAKGTPAWWDVIVTAIPNADASRTQLLLAARDITVQRRLDEATKLNLATIKRQKATLERQQAALQKTNAQLEIAVARLEGLAITDGLTGLKNHRAFQDRLLEEYNRAIRYNSPLSVVMLDVDWFKRYNDTYGHPAGDTVLKQVAAVLQKASRNTDIVARYGGEEFVLILPETSEDGARLYAERLRQALADTAWEKEGVTASFGVATLSPTTTNAAVLVGEADKALYRSKHQGRNCVTHFADDLKDETETKRTQAWFNELIQTLLAAHGATLLSASEQMRELLVQSYDATVVAWSHILDLRDKETEGHSERVTERMVQLTQHLGCNEQEIMFARWGACLHDIGKMGVPDQILHKPGPLTDAEWVVMRSHTTVAHEMLLPIKFLGDAIDIPYCHHEKWDGSGYPQGLKGDEIPMMARLFAVIDVYDALSSDRPYRKAWPEERTLAHLKEQAGTHFDVRAVDAFLSMLEAQRAVRKAA